jgi:superfamily II RNA helicase
LELDTAEAVALLTCMFPCQKSKLFKALTPSLQKGVDQIQAAARKVCKVAKECKLELDETKSEYQRIKYSNAFLTPRRLASRPALSFSAN